MNRIINNVISGFFKGFVPVTYLTFIIAGLISALVSGLIEYQVFLELFPKNNGGSKWLILSIPLLIVSSFEITKIFLIFLDKQSQISNNINYKVDQSKFRYLRYILIFISFFATLIFSYYNLQNPEFDKVIEKRKAELDEQYEAELKEINNSFDKQINLLTQEIDRQISVYDTRMITEERFKFKNSQEYRGPRFNEAKKNKENQEKRRLAIVENTNIKRRNEIKSLFDKIQLEKQKASEELNQSNTSGNKMLSATLRVLNLNAKFPEWQYIMIITILSLIMSAGLEFIIWSSFTVLAINHGDIFDFGIQTEKYKNATEAEIIIDNVQSKSDIKKARNYASNIINTVKSTAKDLTRKMRKDINKKN
ncbi:hypothetical protein GWK08_05575 [Leptobacterium flavescens]|uniref:DUF4407 domain-containing protein n=1 Tax=Leptobacterium flavescens TaxID=472055 RepID=A0A6P0UM21_9FLAO|nr:hypothetical protein [Leptobacterium flavescens]NER12899.1 hypothetical protein [Leptobacterium flavescens]